MARVLIGLVWLGMMCGMLTQQGTAQDAVTSVTLRWFGMSMFQLETSAGKKIVFDPHAIPEFGRNLVQADVILCSHLHSDHTQTSIVENAKSARLFYGVEQAKKGRTPEWKAVNEKVGQISIRAVGLYHDNDDGLVRGKVSAFIVECDGLKFCHLGDLGHELTAAQVKAIGPVDVLMVPCGGIYTINGDGAKRAVAKLKPRLYVLPMHYGVPGYDELLPLDEFLDGPTAVKKLPNTNELVIPLELKADAPTIVVLGWTPAKK